MLDKIGRFFGLASKTDYPQLLKEGAVIIDVRSEGEYVSGHIKGSINAPVDNVLKFVSKIAKNKPIITCCASGMRSAMAKNTLKANGFTRVYNGGSWTGLQKKLNQQ